MRGADRRRSDSGSSRVTRGRECLGGSGGVDCICRTDADDVRIIAEEGFAWQWLVEIAPQFGAKVDELRVALPWGRTFEVEVGARLS